jgi:hypothetical protein
MGQGMSVVRMERHAKDRTWRTCRCHEGKGGRYATALACLLACEQSLTSGDTGMFVTEELVLRYLEMVRIGVRWQPVLVARVH